MQPLGTRKYTQAKKMFMRQLLMLVLKIPIACTGRFLTSMLLVQCVERVLIRPVCVRLPFALVLITGFYSVV